MRADAFQVLSSTSGLHLRQAHKPIHIDGMAAAVEPPAMEWHMSKGKMKDVSLM